MQPAPPTPLLPLWEPSGTTVAAQSKSEDTSTMVLITVSEKLENILRQVARYVNVLRHGSLPWSTTREFHSTPMHSIHACWMLVLFWLQSRVGRWTSSLTIMHPTSNPDGDAGLELAITQLENSTCIQCKVWLSHVSLTALPQLWRQKVVRNITRMDYPAPLGGA